MQRSSSRTAIWQLLLLCLLSLPVFSQTSKGSIAGNVTDSSGAVIPGASVNATSKETGEARTVTTGPTGSYRIEAVNPGTYKITFSMQGFTTTTVDKVEVQPSVISPVDGKLQVGATETTVVVEAGNNEVHTENGELSHTLTTREITAAPIANLNPIQLVLTEPGVTDPGNRGISNGVNFSVNGTRPRSNNFLLDGQDNNDNSIQGQAFQPVNANAVETVSILTNSYSAEFGRGGGSVTNVVYKSGTNRLHGSLWELYQGSGLNAVAAEDGLGGITSRTKPRFDLQTYGFAVGGPIARNKLFFFASSQWQRFYGKANPATIALPTPAGAAVLQSVGSPNANLLFQYIGNLRGDPNSSPFNVAIGNGRPDVQFGLVQRPAPPQQNPDTQWNFKVDYLASQNDTLSVRYLHDRQSLSPDFFNFPSSLPGLDPEQGGPSENLGTTWTHVFNSRTVNEFRASYGNINFAFAPTAEALANPLFQLPEITITGIGNFPALGVDFGLPQGRGHTTYQAQDALTLTRGRHIFKTGFDIARLIVKDQIPFNGRGTLTFNSGGGFTGLGNFLDDFSGQGTAAQKAFGNPEIRPKVFQQSYFLQDTWKLRENLTVDLGVRYEFQNNPENQLPFPGLDLNNPFTPLTQPVRVKEDGNNWAPRVGFAYTPHFWNGLFGHDKTVIRAAYGMFYDSFFTNILDNTAAASPNAVLAQAQATDNRGFADALGLVNTLSPVLNPRSSVTSVDSNLRNPLIHQWNFNIERELPWKLLASVAYVGTRGERLFAQDQLNPLTGFDADGNVLPRVNPDRGSILIRDNGGDSIYHGMNVKVERRVSSGLQIRTAYTLGKLIDDASEVFFLGDAGRTASPQNPDPRQRRTERGLSAYDVRQRLVVSYVWQVPGLKNSSNGFLNSLGFVTRGWEWSGSTVLQSGTPSTFFVSGIDTDGDGNAQNNRPFLGNPSAPLSAVGFDGQFLDSTATCTVVPGTLYLNGDCNSPVTADQVHFIIKPGRGNVGRNTYTNPGAVNFDMAVTRSFRIPGLEGHNLQARAEMYNVFNHANLTNGVDTAVNDGDSFLNTRDARFGGRKIYLELKYIF